MSKDITKSRQFTFLIYTEHLPDDWVMRLTELGLPMAISPLHDSDFDKKLNAFKKEHYHGIVVLPNPITQRAVTLKINRALKGNDENYQNCVPLAQYLVTSMYNTYLYLTHESESAKAKGKHVYNKSDIKLLNNFDISRYIVLDESEKEDILLNLIDLICEKQLANVLQLRMYLDELRSSGKLGHSEREIQAVIKSNTGYLRLYFDGVYQETEKKSKLAQKQEVQDDRHEWIEDMKRRSEERNKKASSEKTGLGNYD